jgi:hypothetical protein
MMRGTVNARLEAVLRLRITGPTGIAVDVDAVVDTGFTNSLVLPSTPLRRSDWYGGRVAPRRWRMGRFCDSTPMEPM